MSITLGEYNNFVSEQLNSLQHIPKKSAGDTIMIPCPFHNDTDPSLGIYAVPGMDIPLGFWHCFGCHKKGHWNMLAEKLGMEQLKQWNSLEVGVHNMANAFEKFVQAASTTNVTLKQLMQTMGNPSYFPWTQDTDWRSIPGRLVNRVGGHYLQDNWKRDREMSLFLPVKIGKSYRGGVRAIIEPKGKALKYVNTGGDWAKDFGLFPYHFVQDMVKKYKINFVVIVEGPRDALRLISLGIPALALLGTAQFTVVKAKILDRLRVDHIYIMPDNDTAGEMMVEKAEEALEEANIRTTTSAIWLPQEYDEDDNLIKLDPCSMESKEIIRLKKNLCNKHKSRSIRLKGLSL